MDARTIERLRLAVELIDAASQPVYEAWREAKNAHGWGSAEEHRLNGLMGDLSIATERVEQALKGLEGE
jgi:hypothetical protein